MEQKDKTVLDQSLEMVEQSDKLLEKSLDTMEKQAKHILEKVESGRAMLRKNRLERAAMLKNRKI